MDYFVSMFLSFVPVVLLIVLIGFPVFIAPFLFFNSYFKNVEHQSTSDESENS